MSQPMIEIRQLSKCYRLGSTTGNRTLPEAMAQGIAQLFLGRRQPAPVAPREFWALRNINLNVEEGEVLGIIGHNGAGKSTLLKILSQITDPTDGEAILRGRVASLLEVGTGFHPELTGRENIYLNGAVLGMSRREISAKFDQIVDFSGVEAFLNTPVKRYSSGMTVRLAFAVAAHLEPEILVVDEVLAVGDAEFQRKCLGKMSDVSRSGRTILFVSHNMGAIQQLCPRVIYLAKGQVVADGDGPTVVARYLDDLNQRGTESDGLATLPRREQLGRQIRLSACRLLKDDHRVVERVGFGEPFTIEIEASGHDELRQVSIVAGIDAFTGGRVLTSASEEVDLFASVHEGTSIKARFRVEGIRLAPGRYSVALGIRSQKGPLDHLEHAHRFDVAPVLHDRGIKPNELMGVVQIEPRWQLETIHADMATETSDLIARAA